LAALAAMAAGGGCGESGGSDEEAQVRQTVKSFYAALERRDGKRACAALTDRARRETEAIDGSNRPCEVALVDLFGGQPPPRITSIEIGDGKATVGLMNGEGGNASLVKTSGSWRFDAY
jgi:hypothetical protein